MKKAVLCLVALGFLVSCSKRDASLNMPPAIFQVSIGDGPYYRTSVITAEPGGWSDAEGDAPNYLYQWFVNGEPVDGATERSFSAAGLQKGDRVACNVTPVDDFSRGEAVFSNTVAIAGSLPQVAFVTLGSGPYYKGSSITAQVAASDEDGDTVELHFTWYVNGEAVEGVDGPYVSADALQKGDRVMARVIPVERAIKPAADDDFEAASEAPTEFAGVAVDSNVITIMNTPPTPPSVAVYPAVATSGTPIWANVLVESADVDGDSVHYTYDWYKNGELQDFPIGVTSIPGEFVEAGDAWVAFVTPSDGMDLGFAGLAPGPIVAFSDGEQVGGAYHTCVRSTLKTLVRCWGLNDYGQLGDGTTNTRTIPSVVSLADVGSTDQVVKMALGYAHTCVLLAPNGVLPGTVRCWGRNDMGQLGRGTTTTMELTPAAISGFGGQVKDISAGAHHTCIILNDNTLRCWGDNSWAQLGNGTQTNSSTPIGSLGSVSQLSLSETRTCVVLSSGSISCWGKNTGGLIPGSSNDPQKTPYTISSSVTFKTTAGSMAISEDGACAVRSATNDLYCWGVDFSASTPTLEYSGTSVVTAGLSHFCIATTTGGMKCRGGNQYGQLGTGTNANAFTFTDVVGFTSGVKSVSAGAQHSCAIKGTAAGRGGILSCFGDNTYGQLGNQSIGTVEKYPVNNSNWSVGIDAGDTNTCVVTEKGTLRCWGDNSQGQLGNGTVTNSLTATPVRASAGVDLTNVVGVAVGHYHVCALTDSGTAKCWGDNTYGQLGDNTTTDRLYPVNVVSGTYSMLAAGDMHTCGINTAGDVYCWGYNGSGQVDSSRATRLAPVNVALPGGVKAFSIAAAKSHTCVGTTSDEVYCWGSNAFGQLGDGTTTWRSGPTKSNAASGGMPWRIAAHDSHTCAQYRSGSTWCWGKNTNGQLGQGDYVNRPTPVAVAGVAAGSSGLAVGYEHTCAISVNGPVYCWGRNQEGEIGDGTQTVRPSPTQVSDLGGGVVGIAAGGTHTCALLNGGTVKCWGRNAEGQIGNNATVAGMTDRPLPVDVLGHTSLVTAIGAGLYHTCDVYNGSLMCWGSNTGGQLGDNTRTLRATPVTVSGPYNASAVGGGNQHTCALGDYGILCWGENGDGQLGRGNTTDSLVPVYGPMVYNMVRGLYSNKCLDAAGYGTVDGTNIQLWDCLGGWNQMFRLDANGSFRMMYYDNMCIDVSGGTVANGTNIQLWTCNGSNAQRWYIDGQVIRSMLNADYCIDISANGTANGTNIQLWSCNEDLAQNFNITSSVNALTVGSNHNCAIGLTSQGVSCWGDNAYGQLGDGTNTDRTSAVGMEVVGGTLTTFSRIDGGDTHTCAMHNTAGGTGIVECWGRNDLGQLGMGANTGPYATPVRMKVGRNNRAFGVGGNHTCVAKSGGGMQCTGWNDYGQIGNNTESNSYATVQTVLNGGGSTIQTGLVDQIEGGYFHTCAIYAGNLDCWGWNNESSIGVAKVKACKWNSCPSTHNCGCEWCGCEQCCDPGVWTQNCEKTARRVLTGGVTMVSTVEATTCAIQSGGVKCWGRNGYGQCGNGGTAELGTPTYVSGIGSGAGATIVATGNNHSCALVGTTIKCWGRNDYGQLGNGNNTQSLTPVNVASQPAGTVTDIHAGEEFTCANIGGAAYCWGLYWNGRIGSNIGNRNVPTAVVDATGQPVVNVQQLKGGRYHTCAIRTTGQTVCWGYDNQYQLGNNDGSATDKFNATQVSSYAGRVRTSATPAFAAGGQHTCVIENTGKVLCTGQNALGQLGNGTTNNSNVPSPATGISNATSVAAGFAHSCAIDGGTVKCWGSNEEGQIGDGTTTNRTSPVTVTLAGATKVVAGWGHTCAIISDTSLRCWGRNNEGQLGDNTRTRRTTPVTVIVNAGGTPLTGVLDVTAGYAHTCARLNSGATKCWGSNNEGQVGDAAPSLPVRTAVTAKPYDGYAYSSISLGEGHGCAKTSTNAVHCWGANTYSQLGQGELDSAPRGITLPVAGFAAAVQQVVSGGNHACALLTGGVVQCWGDNTYGQVGSATPVQSTPYTVAGVTATALGLGLTHTCAALVGGGVKCWGANYQGQLGIGSTSYSNQPPTTLPAFAGITVSGFGMGYYHSCAYTSAGKVYCWGFNGRGQLGLNDTTTRTSPTALPAPLDAGVSALTAGENHTCAIDAGVAYCWGADEFGQAGNDASLSADLLVPTAVVNMASGVSRISAYGNHTCGIISGRVRCWGSNDYGELGGGVSTPKGTATDVPGFVNGALYISTGLYGTCAVDSYGAIRCWGSITTGQVPIWGPRPVVFEY